MKQIISSILALSLCISVPAPIFAADQTNEHNTFFTKQYLSENTTLQQVKSLQTHRSSNVQYNIDVEILHDMNNVNIDLIGNSLSYHACLSGESYNFITTTSNGFFGVYEGDFINEDGSLLHVIADITYTNSEMFVALTLGYAGDENFQILYFGELSDSLASISTAYADTAVSCENDVFELNATGNTAAQPASISSTFFYQGGTKSYLNGSVVADVNVFHANELSSNESMTTYVKVNSNDDNMLNYVKGLIPSDQSLVTLCPDGVTISMSSQINELHVFTDAYYPKEDKTTYSIGIPFISLIAGDVIGSAASLLNITMTVSSTDVTLEKVGSGISTDNKITWEIIKNSGFALREFDGDVSTETGFSARASYQFEGTVTNTTQTRMIFTGSIRYQYTTTVDGITPIVQHIRTSTATVTSNLKLVA